MSKLNSFLGDITASLRKKNGERITELIRLDVERLPQEQQMPYFELNIELQKQFPKIRDEELLERCRRAVPDEEFVTFTSPFAESLARYFRYLRDLKELLGDNLARALEIQQLTSQCVVALGDSRYGIVMIPIVLAFSRTLASIAANLDRNPALLRGKSLPTSEGSTVSFAESTANILRDAFVKCLAGSPGTPRLSRPTPSDKRVGIYLTANSALALLSRSGKLRNATQLFNSIDAQSPPLAYYPAAQRVTYLYYLGRYHFLNNHFLRASIVLEAAYRQTPSRFLSHRRLILIYLVAANLTLGRQPSMQLITRPECATFGHIFMQISSIMRSGDIGAFHYFLGLSPESKSFPHTQFLLKHRILLQLRNRCEVFVWRSLIRQVFRNIGYIPPPDGPDSKKIPYLYLGRIRYAALFSFQRMPSQYYNTLLNFVHPDFVGTQSAIAATGFDPESVSYDEEMENSNEEDIDDPFLPLAYDDEEKHYPTIFAVESTVLSLIYQGFLGGFLSKSIENPERGRWAIAGAKQRGGAIPAGFPNLYGSVIERAKVLGSIEGIPGWVKEESLIGGGVGGVGIMTAGGGSFGGGGRSMAGRVVNLSGARPVGAA